MSIHMNKLIIIMAIASVTISIMLIFLIKNPLPCDYINFAWGAVKIECDCLGIKADTSCKTPDGNPCPDAGGETGCIGIIKEKRCYDFNGRDKQNAQWDQV